MASSVAFTPHPYQAMVLKSTARFIAAVTGVQGGKTTSGAVWLIREIKESYDAGKRCDWLIGAPTVKILQQSTIPKFKEFFNKLGWGDFKEGKQEFELKWGNRIFVRSLEDPDLIEGMTIAGAWLDEAGQMKHQAWINVQARVAIELGRVLMTTTPYACNWLQSDVYNRANKINGVEQQGEGKEKEIEVFNWRSVDNPAFAQGEYDRAKRTMSKEMFERRYEGSFTRLEGLVYKDFEKERDVMKAFHLPPEWKRFGGMDFGHSTASAILSVAMSPEEKDEKGKVTKPSTFYVYREFYKKQPMLREMAEYIKLANHKYTLGDPRGAQEMAELSKGFGARGIMAADNDVQAGIERIKSLFKEGRLKIFSCCTNTIDELESYHYQLDNPDKPTQDAPVKVHDHAMDALKYAFSRQLDGIYPDRVHHAGYQMRRLKIDLPRRSDYRPHDSLTGY